MSSFISLVTSLSSTTASSAQPAWALVISCRIAVKKPWGLKKPVIQKTLGRPSNNQLLNWAWRSNRSVNQNPIVADSHEICRCGAKKRWIFEPRKHFILSFTPRYIDSPVAVRRISNIQLLQHSASDIAINPHESRWWWQCQTHCVALTEWCWFFLQQLVNLCNVE